MDYKKITDYINKLGSKNNLYNLVIVLLVGLLLLIVTNFFQSTSTVSAEPTNSEPQQVSQLTHTDRLNYELSKKNELKNILGLMNGVGRVEVMIHFGSGEEVVPAVNITSGTSSTKEKDNEGGVRDTTQNNTGSTIVMTTRGSNTEPFILQKNYPKVTGVIIVAEGAGDKQIQYEIVSAVSKVFGIPANKVEVYPMRK